MLSPKVILLGCLINCTALSAQIKSPQEFVGFKVGSDRKLIGWDTVVDYFWMLDAKSDRLSVQELGRSTLDEPLIMAFISSSTNLLNLAKYKNLQRQAANPQHLSAEDARALASRNKLVVMLTLNAHAAEIASSQTSIELAYSLATRNDDTIANILENVIILLVPSLNPDGMQLLVDWYNQHLDTPFEGSPLPFVDHYYAGQDNNRDWAMMNLSETKLVARQLYREWFPEIVVGLQQMRTEFGARLRLPTFENAAHQNVNQLLFDEMNQLCRATASELTARGFQGITYRKPRAELPQGSLARTLWLHNMIGMAPEVATVQIATPIYFPKGRLLDQLPRHSHRTNSFTPWSGGWWRVRDVIDYELAFTLSFLDLAAKQKESLIYNFCTMNLSAIQKGKTEPPFAFVVPKSQHDPVTAALTIDALLQGGVEIHLANEDFRAGDQSFRKGDYVILLAQPSRAYVKALLERRKQTGRNAAGLQNANAHTLPTMMGVEIRQVSAPFEADLTPIKNVEWPKGTLQRRSGGGFLISHATNRSFTAVNRLLSRGRKVYWLMEAPRMDGKSFGPGAIYVPHKQLKVEQAIALAHELSIEVVQTDYSPNGAEAFYLRAVKLGLYKPWTANEDEGWTRFILEQFKFPYKSIYSSNMASDNLRGDFDVIIIPDMAPDQIINGRRKSKPNMYSPKVPDAYRDGITRDGVKNLTEFVEKGGVLITLNRACDFAIEELGLPAENALQSIEREFLSSSSLLELVVETTHPLAYGMPSKAAAMFVDSPAFRSIPWSRRTGVAALYADANPLISGSILGADKVGGHAAVLDIPFGKGRVVLIGFKAQYRGQTAGTYKFLFNAIQSARAEVVTIKE